MVEVLWFQPWIRIRSRIFSCFAFQNPDSDPVKRGIVTPIVDVDVNILTRTPNRVNHSLTRNKLCDGFGEAFGFFEWNVGSLGMLEGSSVFDLNLLHRAFWSAFNPCCHLMWAASSIPWTRWGCSRSFRWRALRSGPTAWRRCTPRDDSIFRNCTFWLFHPAFYRVSHLVWDLGWVSFVLNVPPCCRFWCSSIFPNCPTNSS